MPEKLLLDTDIGSDIDDAVCLAYLLAQPACDLLGVTTVSGAGLDRARMASALCRIAGRDDIPIHPGVEAPLIIPSRQREAPQAAVLDKWPHQREFPIGGAIEFMRRIIRTHPGEVTLLAIGPLTNVALLFAVDAEIPRLLKRLVIMGGHFTAGPEALEWNIMLDPHAARMVYSAKIAVHRSIGLDVTRQVVMDVDAVRRKFAGVDLLKPVLDFADMWFKDHGVLTFHDPLAAVTIFAPEVCTFTRGRVAVNLQGGDSFGNTALVTGDPPMPHEVAATVNADAFFAHYFGVFNVT